MQLSLFSISYGGLWGQAALDLPAFIAKAASLGYRHVMLAGKRPHLSPLDYTPNRIAELRNIMDQHGISCPAVAAYTDFAGMTASEVPATELQLAYIEALCRLGQGLGANIVRVFTSYESETMSVNMLWSRTVVALREACDRAAAFGCTLAVQNHHDLGVHTHVLLELLADIDRPNCKLGFDAWSPALRGENLYHAARDAAPYTVMTTNADYVQLPRFQYRPALINYERVHPNLVRAVPFGDGFINYTEFFQGLVDGGFQGIANYEICSPIRGGGALAHLDAYASQYIKWMNEKSFASLEGERS